MVLVNTDHEVKLRNEKEAVSRAAEMFMGRTGLD